MLLDKSRWSGYACIYCEKRASSRALWTRDGGVWLREKSTALRFIPGGSWAKTFPLISVFAPLTPLSTPPRIAPPVLAAETIFRSRDDKGNFLGYHTPNSCSSI